MNSMARLTKEQQQQAKLLWEATALSFAEVGGRFGISGPAVFGLHKRQQWVRKNVNVNAKEKVNIKKNVNVKEKINIDDRVNDNINLGKWPDRFKRKLKKTDAEKRLPMLPTLQEVTEYENDPQGRPRLYQPGFDEMAFKICLMGASNPKISEFFNIAESTLYKWMNDYPSFSEAIGMGRVLADGEIAHSLYHRAKGYTHKEVKTALHEGEWVSIEIDKHYPPEVGAMKMWMYNRQPELWKDKIEVISTGQVDKELMEKMRTVFDDRLKKARDRQREILIERGFIIEG